MNDGIVIAIALCFNALDMLTGIVSTFKPDIKLCSSKLRDGLFKKMGFVFCYALAWLIEYASSYIDLPINIPLLMPVVVYVVWTEIISIIENICKINPKITPSILRKLIGVDENGLDIRK